MEPLSILLWGFWTVFFTAITLFNLALIFLKEEPLSPEVVVCPYCRTKTLVIEYHLERRCPKRPKSLVIKPKSFKDGERPW
jgi:hypothetical protein